MTEALHNLLTTYLDAGYQDVRGFWMMTIPEIIALLESASRRMARERQRHENDTKQEIIMLRNLSIQIGESVACLFDHKQRTLTPLSTYYPGLFKPVEELNEVSLEAYTDMFEDFAYRHNQSRKKAREGGDTHGRQRADDTEAAASRADRQHGATAVSDEASSECNTVGD